jgi:hypothetical protein
MDECLQALRLGKFDYRLSNRLETELQKLRCRVNYHALRFTQELQTMGQTLVERLRQKSNNRYITVHLRYGGFGIMASKFLIFTHLNVS